MITEEKPEVCPGCNKGSVELEFAEDPYMSEIEDDHTPVWLCDDCRWKSAQDI